MLDFRIYTFLAVCSEMSVTKAAKKLNMTQPNVSQHIHFLETYYGQELFQIKGKKIALTKEGEILKEAMTAMCREEKALKEKLSENREREFSFGITKSVNESYLKSNVVGFLKEHAEYHVRFEVGNTERLIRKMENLEMDFAIIEGDYDYTRFDAVVLSKESFIPVMGKKYRLKCFDGKLGSLLKECLILREKGSGTREILESVLADRGINLKDFESVAEIGEISAIRELVESGCGITFLYEAAIRDELESGELVKIPLEDFELRHAFSMIWPRSAYNESFYRNLAERYFMK